MYISHLIVGKNQPMFSYHTQKDNNQHFCKRLKNKCLSSLKFIHQCYLITYTIDFVKYELDGVLEYRRRKLLSASTTDILYHRNVTHRDRHRLKRQIHCLLLKKIVKEKLISL